MKSFKQFVTNLVTLQLAFAGMFRMETTPAKIIKTSKTTDYSLSEIVELYFDDWDTMSVEDRLELMTSIASDLETTIETLDENWGFLCSMCDKSDAESYDEAEATKIVSSETEEVEEVIEGTETWHVIEGVIMHPIISFVQEEVLRFLVSSESFYAEINGQMLPLESAGVGDNAFANELRLDLAQVTGLTINEVDLHLFKYAVVRLATEWSKTIDKDVIDLLANIAEILAPNLVLDLNRINLEVSTVIVDEPEEALELNL